MVVKTEKCAFSEYNVYPGHGMRMVRRDGQPVTLGGSKTKSMMLQRMKPSKLQWTQGWRRLNKKMQVDTTVKKRTRKTTKFQRAIVGASLEDLKKKKTQKPHERSAQREAALREVKERNKAKKAASKKSEGGAKGKAFQKTKGFGKGATGGKVR